MGIGEALVNTFDEKGISTPLSATLFWSPMTRMGVYSPEEIDKIVSRLPLIRKYNIEMESDSAHEILS